MASRGHDFILEMVQMKMKQLGYKLVASDGHYRDIKFPIPPTILNHRPDALGYDPNRNSVCIGEAKYYGDLGSMRSHTQIKDFINLTKDRGRDIRVIFGLPISEEKKFLKILRIHDLELNDKILLIKVPDRLIPKRGREDENI